MAWELTGNKGTNPPTDFLGTTGDNPPQPLVIKTHGTERLRVDTSGNVGIGTATPAASLDVANGLLHVGGIINPTATEQGAYLGWNALTGGTGETDFINNQGGGTGGFAFMNTPPSGNPRATLMVITGNGNVGIGTASPSDKLHIDPNGPGGILIGKPGSNPDGFTSLHLSITAEQGGFAEVQAIARSGTTWGTLALNPDGGNLGIGTTTPGGKLEVVDGGTSLRFANEGGPAVLRVENSAPASLAVVDLGNASRHWQLRIEGNDGDKFYLFDATRVATPLTVDTAGNVGIGTTSPTYLLDLRNSTAATQIHIGGMGGDNGGYLLGYSTGTLELIGGAAWDGTKWIAKDVAASILTVGGGGFNLCGNTGLTVGTTFSPAYRMFMDSSGNVGIGTSSPSSKLHVSGSLTVTGDIFLTDGADCAEDFDAIGEPPESGTVVVIDEGGALRESRDAYDKKVAGVISGAGEYRHAIVLDKRSSEKCRVPVALVGKVYCKVDAQYSPIEVGDSLTTSPTPGHAMKVLEPERAFGSVIGKALRPLEGGLGTIPILITLQ
jgi:hypothetical protein